MASQDIDDCICGNLLLFCANLWLYDPVSGQFTQQYPIGISGGLNVYGFVGGDPVNFSDPFGLSPWGKLVKLGVHGFKWVSKQVSGEALDEAVSVGDDVIMSSRREAFDLANRHSPGGRPIGPERSPGPGNRPHYHTNPRNGSHIFYSVAAALTVSNYVSEDASGVVKAGAAVLDFFNPLGVFNDAAEIYQEVAGTGNQSRKAKTRPTLRETSAT